MPRCSQEDYLWPCFVCLILIFYTSVYKHYKSIINSKTLLFCRVHYCRVHRSLFHWFVFWVQFCTLAPHFSASATHSAGSSLINLSGTVWVSYVCWYGIYWVFAYVEFMRLSSETCASIRSSLSVSRREDATDDKWPSFALLSLAEGGQMPDNLYAKSTSAAICLFIKRWPFTS